MMDTGFHDIISSMNSSTNLSTSNSSDEKLRAENRNLKAEIESLKKQLDWLKRQIFGQKRERFIDTSRQMTFADLFEDQEVQPEQPQFQDVPAHKRRISSGPADDGVGLFFDDRVPVETISLPCKEAEGLSPDQYEVISEKVTHRLAQRPGAFVILLQGIDPYDYLVDVLQRLGNHPDSRVHELTPRLWKLHFSDKPLRSPLHNLTQPSTTPTS